jgi:hypothetical protein
VRKGTSPQSFTAIASFVDAAVIDSAAKSDKNAAWVRHRAPARGGQATTPGPSRTDRLTSGAIAGSKAPERSGKAAKRSVGIARHDAAISLNSLSAHAPTRQSGQNSTRTSVSKHFATSGANHYLFKWRRIMIQNLCVRLVRQTSARLHGRCQSPETFRLTGCSCAGAAPGCAGGGRISFAA